MKPQRLLARLSLRHPFGERVLRAACAAGVPGAGGVAHAYTEVLETPCIRTTHFDGYTLRVNVAEYRGVASYFRKEPHTFWFVPELVRPGDVCLDVGANMGHYTLMLAAQVGKEGGRVIAFEPQPFFADLIRQSALDNELGDAIVVDQRAAYRTTGEALSFFFGEQKNSGVASLHASFQSGARKGERRGAGSMNIVTVTLADAFDEHDVKHCRILKIDVEGAEYDTLLGCRTLLDSRRVDFVVIETHTGSQSERLLLDAGYAGYRIDEVRQTLTPLTNVPSGQFGDSLHVSPEVPVASYTQLGL